MKRLWRRFREENKRMVAEAVKFQLEMDAKENSTVARTLFPKRPYKFSTIAIFSVFIFFLSIALLVLAKEFLIPLFRLGDLSGVALADLRISLQISSLK